MDIIIVGITKAFGRHCIGGIEMATGRRVRLCPQPTGPNDTYRREEDQFWQTNHPFQLGTVWRVQGRVPANLHPPHTENLIVNNSIQIGQQDLTNYMSNRPESWAGNMQNIFDRRLHITNGKLYALDNDPPRQSTGEWRADRDFKLDQTSGESRYTFSARGNHCSVKYVGNQTPIQTIPTGTLVRFSLAKPFMVSGELRCYLQLSGWFI